MRHFFRQFTKYDYLFFAICGIAYYFLIRQYIPGFDDLYYRFSRTEGTPITSFSDAIIAQAHDYMQINGRFLTHVFIQLFCSIWSIVPFYIISAFFFMLLVMGMTWLVRHFYGTTSSDKYLLVTGLLFTIPVIGMTFLGLVAYIINYLWSAAIYVTFLCTYFYLRDEHPILSLWQSIALCSGAFVAGTWQESFSIGIAGALLFYHIVHQKDTRGILLYFLISFAIGVLICTLAPSNFVRLQSANVSYAGDTFSITHWLSDKIYNLTMLVKHCPTISIFCILIILIPILQRKHTWQFIKENYFLLMPCFIMFVFGCFLAFAGEHQFVIIGVFSSILFVNLLWATAHTYIHTINTWISVICIIIISIVCIPAYYYRSMLCDANIAFESSIKHPEDSICVSTEIEHVDREVIGNSFYRKYTCLFSNHWSYDSILFFRKYARFLSSDYQAHALVTLPEPKEQVIAHCNEANLLSDYVYNAPILQYYIIRIPKEWDASKVICTVNTTSCSMVDKGKDIIMNRKGRITKSTGPVGYNCSYDEDPSRWFIDGDYKYIICGKPISRTFITASISYNI